MRIVLRISALLAAMSVACPWGVVMADSVSWVTAPTTVRAGNDIVVSFECVVDASTNARHVYAGVAETGTSHRWLGIGRAPAIEGTHTTSVIFRLDAAAKVDGQEYVLVAFMAEELDGVWSTTASAADRPVTVVADRAWWVAVPEVVENGRVETVRMGYRVESNSVLSVDLLRPDAPVGSDWFGGTSVTVVAGSGTTTVSVAVENTPGRGQCYQWSAFVGPDEAESNAVCAIKRDGVIALADLLSMVVVPAVVWPGTVVAVTLDYDVLQGPGGKYLSLNLLFPDQGYAWFGGTNTVLSCGTGQTTIQFRVQAATVASTNYLFDAYVAHTGDDWSKATAHDQRPTEMKVDSLSFASYLTNIWTPHGWTVTVHYAASGPRDIHIDLLSAAPNYIWRAGSNIAVAAGTGTISCTISVPANFVSGWHLWSTFSTPPGGAWDDATASAQSLPVWVTQDPVKILAAPTNVARTLVYPLQLSWEVMEDSEIHIDLVREGTYTWHGGAWGVMAAGSGVTTLVVTVDAATPIDTNFMWSSWVGPVGGGYEARTADDVKRPVWVTN